MTDLTIPNDDVGTVTRNITDNDIKECRPGLEYVWIRWCLCDVEDYGTVVLNGEGIVELEESLSHVHSVCRESSTNEHHSCVGSSIIRNPSVGRRGNGDIE